jgi:hypothetical protein
MKQILLLFLFSLMLSFEMIAQDTLRNNAETQVVDGDTLSVVELTPVIILPPIRHESRRQAARYDKLVYNVRKVYPYAKLAGEKLRYYEGILDTIPTEKARKLYLKKAEKELEAQFGDEIRGLTFSQGKILIKLVYRETGNSTFDLVRELRGKFSAFIYQTVARLFGYDLKSAYDPLGEDIVIEQIVRSIEMESQ